MYIVKLPQFDLGVLALHVHLTLMPSVDLPIKAAGLRWGLSHRRGEQRGLPGGARRGVNIGSGALRLERYRYLRKFVKGTVGDQCIYKNTYRDG